MAKSQKNPTSDELALEKLEQARSAQDAFEKYRLLNEALYDADGEDIQKEIEKEQKQSVAALKVKIALHVDRLSHPENYDDFLSSLRLLEGLGDQFPFSERQANTLKEARKWYGEKLIRDDNRVSRPNLGGFADKFVAYDEFLKILKPEPYYLRNKKQETYKDHLANFKLDWQKASVEAYDKVLLRAWQLAASSPNASKMLFKEVLDEKIDCVLEDNSVREVPRYPFADEELGKINSYILALAKPCEQEQKAEELYRQALNAATPYDRYELFLKARDFSWQVPEIVNGNGEDKLHILPGLDKAIKDVYESASEFRRNQIQEKLNTVRDALEQLPVLGKGVIEKQFDKIEKDLDTIYGETIMWSGEGKTLEWAVGGKKETYVLQRPKSLSTLEKDSQQLKRTFSQLKPAYDLLVQQDEHIRGLISSSDDAKRGEGMQAFEDLKKNGAVSRFQVFQVLSSFATQHTSLDAGEKDIRKHVNEEKWADVLRLCRDLKSSGSYKSGAGELKKNIEQWELQASHHLLRQKIRMLVERENYQGAKTALDRSQSEALDWTPIQSYLDKLAEIEQNENGKQLSAFYKKALSAIDLDSMQILLDIVSDQDEVLERMNLNLLDGSELKTAKDILVDSKGLYPLDQIEANISQALSRQLQKKSFDEKAKLLKIVGYVAGKFAKPETGFPPFAASLHQYEAARLYRCLLPIVRKQALDDLRSTKDASTSAKLETASSRVTLFYQIEFSLNEEEREVLKAVEIANAEVRSLANPSDAVEIWGTVKEHFENDLTVSEKYQEAKRDWYLRTIQSSPNPKTALGKIEEALEDEDVGGIPELYWEKANAYFLEGDFSEAKKALKEYIRKFKKTAKAAQFEVEIDLLDNEKELLENPVALINFLHNYWITVDKKHKEIVEKFLRERYHKYSVEYSSEVRKNIDAGSGGREQAWHYLLDLMSIEEIYLQAKPQTKRESAEFLEQLIPTLYLTGIDLIEKWEEFNETIANSGVSLSMCIADGDHLYNRFAAYERLLASMHSSVSERTLLIDVVRGIINSKAREKQKKQFLIELEDSRKEAQGGPERYYNEIQANKSKIFKALNESLRECENILTSACNPEVWKNCALAVLEGNSEPFDPLLDFKKKLEKYKNFSEVQTYKSRLDVWQSTLRQIQEQYRNLREKLTNEDFNSAEKSVEKLDNNLDERILPDFMVLKRQTGNDTLNIIIKQVRDKLTAQNSYTHDHLIGLDAISVSIAELKNEIIAWQNLKKQRETELNNLSQKLRLISDKIAAFKREHYDKLCGYITTEGAKPLLDDYLNSAINLPSLNVQSSTSSGIARPSEFFSVKPETPSQMERTKEKDTETKSSFFSFFKKESSSSRHLRDGVNAGKEINYPLALQRLDIATILDDATKLLNSAKVFLTVRSTESENLQIDHAQIVSQMEAVAETAQGLLKKNDKCTDKVPYPDEKKLKDMWQKQQYGKWARVTIEADLLGVNRQVERDHVNNARNVLLEAKW